MLTVALSACFGPTHGRPLSLEPTSSLPAEQAVRVYIAADRLTLRAVRLTSDSLSGIPWRADLDCTGCRVSLPRATIDSVTMVRTDLSGAANGALIIGTLTGLLIWSLADIGGD